MASFKPKCNLASAFKVKTKPTTLAIGSVTHPEPAPLVMFFKELRECQQSPILLSVRSDIITDFLNTVEFMRRERVKQFQPNNTSTPDWCLNIKTLQNQTAN